MTSMIWSVQRSRMYVRLWHTLQIMASSTYIWRLPYNLIPKCCEQVNYIFVKFSYYILLTPLPLSSSPFPLVLWSPPFPKKIVFSVLKCSLKAHRQISIKRCFENYCSCDQACQFSASQGTPWRSYFQK